MEVDSDRPRNRDSTRSDYADAPEEHRGLELFEEPHALLEVGGHGLEFFVLAGRAAEPPEIKRIPAPLS